jgi:DNA-directed RNA polymerase specialized sigma24 family protein
VHEKVGLFDWANRMKVEKWRVKMSAGIDTTKREILIQEIMGALGQWPEKERNVFSQAHYQGQSVEAISRSLQLDMEEVRKILKLCERRLHASLRDLSKSDRAPLSLPATRTARPAA